MDFSRRSLFAAAVGATCAGLVQGQARQPAAGGAQPKMSTADMPTRLGGKDLDKWILEIKSPDPSRRENAIRTVPRLKGAEKALPALIERVERDDDYSPLAAAISSIGAIPISPGKDLTRLIAVLTRRLNHQQAVIRFHAALLLGRFGEKARQATVPLIEATKDRGSWEIRKAAVFALARTVADTEKPVNSAAINALTQRMHFTEHSALVRLEATMSICSIGKVTVADSNKIVAALKDAERDPEKMVTIWARVGLMVHDNKLAEKDMAMLVNFLRTSEPLPTRTHAARALGTIAYVGNPGPLIKKAIGPLIDMLSDKEELAQIAAIWALGHIGAPAEPALKRLNQMLDDKKISEEGKTFVREAVQMIQSKVKN